MMRHSLAKLLEHQLSKVTGATMIKVIPVTGKFDPEVLINRMKMADKARMN
jgi:hypothetical protein